MYEFHSKRRTRPCVYYQQGKCNRVNCNFSHDVPVVGSASYASGSDGTHQSDSPLPQPPTYLNDVPILQPPHPRPSALRTKPCRFYAKGRCTAGDACRWSHDDSALFEEEDSTQPSENMEFLPNGFKLVHKSYRTLPCARFQKGHCIYGDQCTFIHNAPSPRLQMIQNEASYASSAPTPSARPARDIGYFGSPASLVMNVKSHSQHHSPASALGSLPALGRSLTHSPALVNPMLGRSGVGANVPGSPALSTNPGISALTQSPSMMSRSNSLIAHTPPIGSSSSLPSLGPRDLPPPSSQSRFSGTNWGLPASKPTVLTSSPSLLGAADWSHPSPSVNANPSPFLLTFGEIGPNGVNGNSGYASPGPKSLGLNGATNGSSLAVGSPRVNGGSFSVANPGSAVAVGSPMGGSIALGSNGVGSEVGGSTANNGQPPSIALPSLVFGSTANINAAFPSLLNTDADDSLPENQPRRSRLPSFADTEPDFPSIINYSDMGDYLGDTEDPDEDPSLGRSYRPTNAGDLGNFNSQGSASNGMNTMASGSVYDEPSGGWRGPPAGYADYVQPYPDDQAWRLSYRTRRCKYYVAGSRCPAGNTCTFIHDPEALKRPPENPPLLPPQSPLDHPLYRTRECKYHLAGRCHQENECAFKHTGPAGQGREYENWEGFTMNVKDYDVSSDTTNYRTRPCKWYLKGNCFHGDNCTYLHDPEYLRPACIFWKGGAGHCINGDNCRFSHDLVDDYASASEEDQQRYQEPDGARSVPPSQNGEDVGAEPTNTHLSLVPSQIVPHGGFSALEIKPVQVPTLTHTIHDDEEEYLDDEFMGPYAGPSLGGLVDARSASLNGASALGRLMVDDRTRMELVVSEGEEEDSDDDIVVLKPSNGTSSPHMDKSESTAIEGLFSTMAISTVAGTTP